MSSPPLKHVVAILIASVTALFARAWLQIRLTTGGMDSSFAADLAYLVVPPVLLLLLFPVLIADRSFIRRQFRRKDLTLKIALMAVGVGVLFRVAWHAHIVAGVAVGAYSVQSDVIHNSAVVSVDCPKSYVLLLSILVYSVMIPFIEEIAHRGYVQAYFQRFGPVVAITIASVAFAVYHRISGWEFAMLGGIVLGTTYWLTNSLWAPVIVHAVVNLLPHVTLRCLDIRWSPQPDVLPQWTTGVAAGAISLGCASSVVWLLVILGRGRGLSAPACPVSKRVGNTLDDV